jgi:flagella basal body P-ring formation protein FlgA
MATSWNPEDVLRSYLINNYPWEEIEISDVQVKGEIGNEAPEKIIVEKGPVGRAVFSFVFRNNKKITVRAKVRAFAWVVKSKRPFKKNYVIRDEDIYFAKMDIRKMPNGSVKDPKEISGKSLKRSIIANIPIVEGMVEMYQFVKRGKRVVLLINHGGLNITAAGKTREKGYVGKPVRAINLSSKKEIIGVLIDEKTVKVEL